MRESQNGIPVTYVTNPPVAAGSTIVTGGSVAISGQPIQVYVQGGTIAAAFSFVGSVSTDIGSVKLEDADDNYAIIPPAQDLKTISTKALVVQTVDRLGRTLSLANQEAIVINGSNSKNLLANIDLNTMAASTYLAEIASTQGTQSTALLSTIASQQGTQATSALQIAGNSTLTSILTSLQIPSAGTNLEATLFNAVSTPGNSTAANVNGYTQHTVQHIVTNGSVAHYTQASLDGNNWNLESTDYTSCIVRLTGPCKYVRAVYASGNGTLTSLLNSAKAAGGGGTPNGAGPAEATFSGSILGALGSTYTLPVNGATSIGFKLTRPSNATIIFEGSWDGVNWTDLTLRQMGAHGYSTRTSEDENWIGSVSTFQYFRLRVTTGGTGAGTVVGKFSATMSTLEGIENSNMPHRIGATVTARSFNYSAAVSNGTIWAPSTVDHRLYVSDIHFTVDANTTVIFSDGSSAENQTIFSGAFKPSPSTAQFVPISFTLPHVFSNTNRALMLTSTSTANIVGVIHGYEAE